MLFLPPRLHGAQIIVCIAFLLFASGAGAKVYISEVMWSGTDLSTSDEWMEIGDSSGSGSIDLTGWSVTAVNSGGNEVPIASFATGSSIAANQYLVISHYDGDHSRLESNPFLVSSALTLANTKLLLRLRDAHGSIIDQADDGIGAPLAGSNDKPPAWKASMERVHPEGQGSDASSWVTAFTFLGFDDGASLYGTPGSGSGAGVTIDTKAPAEATNVVVSLTGEGTGRTLELHWQPSSSLDLSRQKLLFEPSLPSGSGTVMFSATGSQFAAPIGAGAYAVTLFSIDRSGNVSTGLQKLINYFVQSSSSSSPLSSSSAESSSSSVSSSASSGSFSSSSSSENYSSISSSIRAESELFFSEILPQTLEGKAGWLELQKVGETVVDPSQWTITDEKQHRSYSLLRLLSGATIGESEYIVLPETLLSLSSNGGELSLKKQDAIVETLPYPALPRGVSYARTSDVTLKPSCWPTQNASNDQDDWNAEIQIQSGQSTGVGKVTLNVQVVPNGVTDGFVCSVAFGDGVTSTSCNPPSHTYSSVGQYHLEATVSNYCGKVVKPSLEIDVSEEDDDSGVTDDSGVSSSQAASRSSNASSLFAKTQSGIVIAAVEPNPVGSDVQEWFALKNITSHQLTLDGWSIKGTKKVFSFSGSLQAKERRVFFQKESKITLQNASGSLSLFEPSGREVSQVTWGKADEGFVYAPILNARWIAVVEHTTRDGLQVRFEGDAPAFVGTGTTLMRFLGISRENKKNIYSNSALNKNKKIELQFDSIIQDQSGSYLAYVSENGGLLQEKLLRSGDASVTDHYPFSRRQEFEAWAEKGRVDAESDAGTGTVLHLSEIYAAPSPHELEWIEVWNPSGDDLSLDGYALSIGTRQPWKIPAGTIAKAQSFTQITFPVGAKLPNKGGQVVWLYRDEAVDDVSFPALTALQSYGRTDTGWCLSLPTPNEETICSNAGGKTASSNKKIVLSVKTSTKSSSKSSSSKKSSAKSSSKSVVQSAAGSTGSDGGLPPFDQFLLLLMVGGGSGYLGATMGQGKGGFDVAGMLRGWLKKT